MTETTLPMVLVVLKDALNGLSHLDFGHSILFRVSDFVLRIYYIKAETPYASLYGVPPERPVLGAGIRDMPVNDEG